MPVSIDSNASSAYYNEEATLKVPGSGKWYPLEPNSYTNFGGDLKTIAREPITASRQRNKGTVTDLDVTAGWNEDFTQNNLTRLIQGFLYASARQKATTAPLKTSTQAALSVTVSGIHDAAGGMVTAGFKVGHIVKSHNFGNVANNFIFNVTAVTATDVTLTPVTNLSHYNQLGVATHETTTLVVEAAGAGGALIAVGYQFPMTAVLSGIDGAIPQVKLDNTGGADLTTLGFVTGEYLYVGDVHGTGVTSYNFIDNTTNTIAYRGWMRIAKITATALYGDVTILENFGTGAAAATATNKANVYFGNVIKNESDPSLIVRRTYSILRTLGYDVTQTAIYELIKGAVPNQFSMNIPSNNKLAADMDFVGMDSIPGTDLPNGFTAAMPWNEDPYNTSQDVYAMLLYVIDQAQPEQVPLFGYATDEKLTINNNVAPNKAIGVVGAFEASTGNFDVSGSLTCYFDDERAISAVRNNADVGLLNIFAKKRQGMIWDLPLLTLGGGLLKVEKNKPIMTDISHTAAASSLNYTVMYNQFEFLPDSAMASYEAVNF